MQNQATFLDEASFREAFRVLQEQLPAQFERDFPDPLSSKTIVVAPSLTLDPEMLSKLKGQISPCGPPAAARF